MGGLDADFVLGGFVATLAYTFSLACLALYNSVCARRAREAIMRTYVMLAGYLIGSWIFSGIISTLANGRLPGPVSSFLGRPPPATSIVDLFDYLNLFGAGNPFLFSDFMNGQLTREKL